MEEKKKNTTALFDLYSQPTGSASLIHRLKKLLFRFVIPVTVGVLQDVILQHKPPIHALLDQLSTHLTVNKQIDKTTAAAAAT